MYVSGFSNGAIRCFVGRMARRHKKTCRICGRSVLEGFYISARGLCPEHSLSREIENINAMRDKRGDLYAHWLRRSHMANTRARVALERGEA